MASVASRVEMALHGTSDFPNILRDVGSMSLSNAYEAAQSAIKQTSREIAASNFRSLHSVKVSAGPDLEEVNEQGEFKSGTVQEGAETFAVKTYGKIFGITRQAIVNDDLDVFSNMFPLLGQGAANTEAKLFAGLLEENAGLGPKLSNGKTPFHASHGNLTQAASSLSVASLGAARVAMRRQTGIAGEAINVVPAFLVVPPELETFAEQLLTEIAASEVANANPFAGKLKLLVEPRFTSATAWYLCAAPGAPDGLQHAYSTNYLGTSSRSSKREAGDPELQMGWGPQCGSGAMMRACQNARLTVFAKPARLDWLRQGRLSGKSWRGPATRRHPWFRFTRAKLAVDCWRIMRLKN